MTISAFDILCSSAPEKYCFTRGAPQAHPTHLQNDQVLNTKPAFGASHSASNLDNVHLINVPIIIMPLPLIGGGH